MQMQSGAAIVSRAASARPPTHQLSIAFYGFSVLSAIVGLLQLLKEGPPIFSLHVSICLFAFSASTALSPTHSRIAIHISLFFGILAAASFLSSAVPNKLSWAAWAPYLSCAYLALHLLSANFQLSLQESCRNGWNAAIYAACRACQALRSCVCPRNGSSLPSAGSFEGCGHRDVHARASPTQVIYPFREAAITWSLQSRQVGTPQALFGSVMGPGYRGHAARPLHNAWTAPPYSHYKLNFEGIFSPPGVNGGIGGILRDYRGRVIFGFSETVCAFTPAHVVLQAFIKSLEFAINLNSDNPILTVFIEANTARLRDAFYEMQQLPPTHIMHIQWEETSALLRRMPRWNLDYVPNEANKVAEALADVRPRTPTTYVFNFPNHIQRMLDEEAQV